MAAGFKRGDVYLVEVELPIPDPADQSTTRTSRRKYLIALQSSDHEYVSGQRDLAVVVCNTKRRSGAPRPFEVELSTPQGFDHATLVDCRYPFSIPQDRFLRGNFLTRLDREVMQEVSIALAVGLQMM